MRQKGARLQKGEIVSTNRYRPSVLASKRVLLWSSPFYEGLLKARGSTAHLQVKVERAILAGLEDSTLTQYGVGLKRFAEFCDQEGISEEDRVPASEFLLCAFASAMALEVVQRTTLNTWLAGLRAWHLSQGAPWSLSSSDSMEMIKKAVAKRAPASKKTLRPPVTIQHLRALADHLDLLNSFDIAVFAVACTAFWSCMRLGEILVDSPRFFDPSRSPSKAMILSSRESREGLPFLSFNIPWTKTTKNEGATVVVNPRQGDPTCPVRALRLHQHANGASSDPSVPFFAFSTTSDHTFQPLTRDAFMSRCNNVWAAAGLGKLTGHSFRIGGATELLLQGKPPYVVQKQGRWKSSAFLLYWRSVDEVIPTYLSDRISEGDLSTLRGNMKDWFASSV
ncbi:hypothetical protein M407DRAFT_78823 [Tulasnella calospora MUT 4182]|uniref:Tyr recombinase domain-containing protein n=1 Tax=Tulasnella calospora MUT 4182 TaxID=1051891 RepID=A0A0C3Q2Q0_9AGAM|nr:hypothetical protein M407DRAFT_78823 [Tulasnella calospora MUT 4182]